MSTTASKPLCRCLVSDGIQLAGADQLLQLVGKIRIAKMRNRTNGLIANFAAGLTVDVAAIVGGSAMASKVTAALADGQPELQAKGRILKTCTLMDATLLHAAPRAPANASLLLPACPTTLKSGSPLMDSTKPNRIITWSSTIKIRAFFHNQNYFGSLLLANVVGVLRLTFMPAPGRLSMTNWACC